MVNLPHAQCVCGSVGAATCATAAACAAVDQLNQQAWDVHATDPPHALTLAAEARDAADRLGYRSGLARSHYILGACHAQLDAYESARTDLLAALAHYEGLGEREPQANALNMLGNIHSALGDHHTAYELYLRSLAIRQALGLTNAEAASWNNIGNVYYHLGEYQPALEAHRQSLALKESLGDQAGAAISLNNIGNVYRARGDLDHALGYYRQSLMIAQAIGNMYSEAGALGNLGALYSALGKPQASLDHHLQSLSIERKAGNRHGEAESLLQLGQLFFLNPELRPAAAADAAADDDLGLWYLRQSYAIADDLHAKEIMMHAVEFLAQLYEQRGDLTQAITAYRQFHSLERALFNEALSEKTKKLQIIHQVGTAMHEAELKRVEAELAHIKNNELQVLLGEADQQREIAEEANRFKTKLLSIAAHDLKNPLNGITGFADLLLLQISQGEPLYHFAAQIRQSATRMTHIINDLLDSTRIESGGLHLTINSINLGLLAQEIVEIAQPAAQQKKQTLIFEAAEACLVQADQSCMWRVLENLVDNAIKFSPYGRRIWVTVAQDAHHVRCAVRDEGPGLTADDQRKLFGRFERLSATPTGDERSTGLGLSIVRQLVELQGGRVWAESAGQDQGSTFIVEIPAYRTQPHV